MMLVTGVVGLMTHYTKLLDFSNPSHVLQLKVLSFVSVVAMYVARGFHWVYLAWQMLHVLYIDEEWLLFVIAGVVSLLFTMYSMHSAIIPHSKRFVKFFKLSPKMQMVQRITS